MVEIDRDQNEPNSCMGHALGVDSVRDLSGTIIGLGELLSNKCTTYENIQ